MLSLLHMQAGDGLLQVLALQMQLGMAGLVVICLFAFAVGACLGSFANACAMRLVRDEDFIFAKSRCRGCDRPLSWWQNLPLIGWLTARGRCATCDGQQHSRGAAKRRQRRQYNNVTQGWRWQHERRWRQRRCALRGRGGRSMSPSMCVCSDRTV